MKNMCLIIALAWWLVIDSILKLLIWQGYKINMFYSIPCACIPITGPLHIELMLPFVLVFPLLILYLLLHSLGAVCLLERYPLWLLVLNFSGVGFHMYVFVGLSHHFRCSTWLVPKYIFVITSYLTRSCTPFEYYTSLVPCHLIQIQWYMSVFPLALSL